MFCGPTRLLLLAHQGSNPLCELLLGIIRHG